MSVSDNYALFISGYPLHLSPADSDLWIWGHQSHGHFLHLQKQPGVSCFSVSNNNKQKLKHELVQQGFMFNISDLQLQVILLQLYRLLVLIVKKRPHYRQVRSIKKPLMWALPLWPVIAKKCLCLDGTPYSHYCRCQRQNPIVKDKRRQRHPGPGRLCWTVARVW